MRNVGLLSLLCAILSSCQVYNSHFECPPGEGIPCTSLTNIEGMIIETSEGPDIFPGCAVCDNSSPVCDKECVRPCENMRRVWMSGRTLPCGTYVEGHYIYISPRPL